MSMEGCGGVEGGGVMFRDDRQLYSCAVLEKLHLQRNHSKYCDVVFHVQEQTYVAHRNVLAACSPYLDSVLKMNAIEKEHFTVPCQNQQAFCALLEYMYTGSLIADKQWVPDLLRLSDLFVIEQLKQLCLQYLESNLSMNNCFSIREHAERSKCHTLLQLVDSFIICNIAEIVNHAEVLDLNYTKLELLISSKSYTLSENQRLALIISWVGNKVAERTRFFRKLLTRMKWSTVLVPEVYDLIKKNELFQVSEYCLFHMLQVLEENKLLWSYYSETLEKLSSKFSEMTGLDQEALVKVAIAGAFDASDIHSDSCSLEEEGSNLKVNNDNCEVDNNLLTQDRPETITCTPQSVTENSGYTKTGDIDSDLNTQASKDNDDAHEDEDNDDSTSTEIPVDPREELKHQEDTGMDIVILSKIGNDAKKKVSGRQPKRRGRPPKSVLDYSRKLKSESVQYTTGNSVSSNERQHASVQVAEDNVCKSAGHRDKVINAHNNSALQDNLSSGDVVENYVKPLKRRGRPRKLPVNHRGLASPRTAKEKNINVNCKICDYVAVSNEKLKLHVKRVHKDSEKLTKKSMLTTKVKCESCDYIAASIEKLRMHSRKAHRDDTVFSCTMCSFRSSWNREYYRHMKKHFEGPPYECDFEACTYITSRIQPLLHHRMVHTDERPFECTICSMRFRTRNNLNTHLRCHTGEKNFVCKTCDKKFAARPHLIQHELIHLNRRFLCDICGFTTKVESHLKAHHRIHTGDVFKCTYPGCSYFTPKRSQLGAHMRVHSSIRSHICSVCGRGFVEKSHLVRHERIHLDDKPFHCTICEYSSTRRDKLKEHINKHHGDNSNLKVSYKPRKSRKKNADVQQMTELTSQPLQTQQENAKKQQEQMTQQPPELQTGLTEDKSYASAELVQSHLIAPIAALEGQRLGLVLPTVVSVPPPPGTINNALISGYEQQLTAVNMSTTPEELNNHNTVAALMLQQQHQLQSSNQLHNLQQAAHILSAPIQQDLPTNYLNMNLWQ